MEEINEVLRDEETAEEEILHSDEKVTDTDEDLSEDIPKCEKIIEAILFAAGNPVEYTRIAAALNITVSLTKKIISDYAERYNDGESLSRGVMLIMYPDACQLCTREEYGLYIRSALGIRRGGHLSPSSLEVLAIIAYNQPVTRAFVDTVRGVDSGYVVSSLCEKGLIESCGRLDVPGRPMIYRTTDNFLRVFGLDSLSSLPDVSLPDGDMVLAPDGPGEQLTIAGTENEE